MLEVLNDLCAFIAAKSPGVIPAILLLDDDGMHLRLAAGPNVPHAWNAALGGLTIPSYPSFQSPAALQEITVPVVDISSDPSFAPCWELVLAQNIRAAWSVPVLSKERKILATLILFCTAPQPLGVPELELLEQAIHMAAIAIESHRNEDELREFSRQLYQSQDQERRRIARELHDSTGQKLAVLGMNLIMAKESVTTQPRVTDRILSDCSSLARNISDELRTLSYLLHPPMLDECGLGTAIQWYVSGINERDGLHVEVEVTPGLRRLSDEAELAIFRIVQASLTNVHLHSRAASAKVCIDQKSDKILVTVSDNGQGIPVGVLNHSSHTNSVGIGITGMRERVKQLGGLLEIDTGHHGTVIKATIPGRHFRTSIPEAHVETQKTNVFKTRRTSVFSTANMAFAQCSSAHQETSTQFGRARSQIFSHSEIRR
jgi:signal transduction histidine kinase